MDSNKKINGNKEGLNQIQTKNYLAEIKSAYILKKIFELTRYYTKFEILRYNKNLQKKININISQYKKYSTIEIEIIPARNKQGQFININNKEEEEKYYHIYFNNSDEEMKRNNILENEKIDKIKIIIDFQIKSFYNLFSYCECIESINFIDFHRKNINNMSFMFYKCTSLKKINFSNVMTINVKNMSCMFFECFLLNELNLSKFDTENVIDMSYMFYQCISLEKLDAPNFNTENVTNMREMFSGCSSLKEININHFNTDSVTSVSNMFENSSVELKEKMNLLDKYSKLFKSIYGEI